MKFRWNNKYFKAGLTGFLVVCGGIMFYYLLFHGANIKGFLNLIYNIMMPIFFGGIMAYLLSTTLNFIEQKLLFPLITKAKLKLSSSLKKTVRMIAIILTALFYYFIIQLVVSMLLSQIIPSIKSIIDQSDTYYKTITIWLDNVLSDNPELKKYVYNLFDEYSGDIVNFVNNNLLVKTTEVIKTISLSVINIVGVLWNFIIGFIISIYLLISKEKFASQAKKMTYAFMNTERANVFINNVRFTHNTFIGFISGKIIDSLIIGVLCFIGTTILKTPYAALVSVIIGITNIIPFFGPFLGAIPTAILVLLADPMHPLNCLYFVIFILILQQIDGNFIGPKILGDSTGLASFWVIFSITVFGGIFGVAGMIIGVPTFAVIYAVIKSQVYTNLVKKNMPTETEAFDNLECVDRDGFQFFDRIKNRKKKAKSEMYYHSGEQFISSVDEWNMKYYREATENREAAENRETTVNREAKEAQEAWEAQKTRKMSEAKDMTKEAEIQDSMEVKNKPEVQDIPENKDTEA